MTEGLKLKIFEDGAAGVVDYTGQSTTVRVPDSYQGRPVRYIAGDAFVDREIQLLLLPHSIAMIGDYEPGYPGEAPVRLAGLGGKAVYVVCEAGCGMSRRLAMEPSFQVELVERLDAWLEQNPQKAVAK